jgi:hypothetical protein
VTVATLFEGFEQAFVRWQGVEQAPQEPARTFIPLFEVLEWAACIDERLEYIDWSRDLRGLRWARHRCRHDWAMALEVRTREELRLHPNVNREISTGLRMGLACATARSEARTRISSSR